MISKSQKIPAWMFIFGWMGVSLLAFLLTWWGTILILKGITNILGDTILVAGQTRITEDLLAMYVIILLVGFFSGLLQFLLVRLLISRAGWWILATLLGWLVVLALVLFFSWIDPLGFVPNSSLPVFILFLVIGGILGLAQRLVLKNHVRQSAWWILISSLAWGLTGLIIGSTISEAYDFWVLLILPGLVTGVGLWWLLVGQPNRKLPALS